MPNNRGYALAVATVTKADDKPSEAVAAKPAHRSHGIDGLRALAATLVFTFHAWWILSPSGIVKSISDAGDAAHLANSALLRFGTVGVALFYLLSGFLLYGPFVAARYEQLPQPRLVPYLIRRAARIIPAYWAALIVIGLAEPDLNVFTVHGLKAYFLFGQIYSFDDLRQGFPLPPMWTICVEVTFYIFLPVWAWVADGFWKLSHSPLKAEFTLLALLAVASIEWKLHVVRHAAIQTSFQPKLIALPASLDLFAAGMALAVVAQAARHHRWELPARLAAPAWAWWLAALACLGLMAATAGPDRLISTNWQTSVLITALIKIPLAVCLAFPVLFSNQGGLIRRALSSRLIAWVGLVSYGLYLWHSFVIDRLAGISRLHHPQLAIWPLEWLLALALSLACAAASWYLIERTAIKYARQRA